MTDKRRDARGKTKYLPTLAGGDINILLDFVCHKRFQLNNSICFIGSPSSTFVMIMCFAVASLCNGENCSINGYSHSATSTS